MATQKQIEANRRNAQKSTGPITEEGKSRAKFNAVKHGMTAEIAVLPHEDPESFDQLRNSLFDSHQPVNASERMLVELVAVNYWRLLRARRIETASFDLHLRAMKTRNEVSTAPSLDDDAGIAAAFANEHDTFRKIERYQSAVERSYFRALENLRKMQNDRMREDRRTVAPQRIPTVPQPRAFSAATTKPAEPSSGPRRHASAAAKPLTVVPFAKVPS